MIKKYFNNVFIYLFITISQFSCYYYFQQPQDRDVGLQNLLLGIRNIFDADQLATRRISGTLTDKQGVPLSNANLQVSKVLIKNDISKNTKTDEKGSFSLDLKAGKIIIGITNSNTLYLGDLILEIFPNGDVIGNVSENSNLVVKDLKSIYIYPNGSPTPFTITGVVVGGLVMGFNISDYYLTDLIPGYTYYMNLEIVNNSFKQESFISSSITTNTPGVSITYPYHSIPSNNSEGTFPGTNMYNDEYRSIKVYRNNYSWYDEFSCKKNCKYRFYNSIIENIINFNAYTSYESPDYNYYKLQLDPAIPRGTIINMNLNLNYASGEKLSLPFVLQITSELPSLSYYKSEFAKNYYSSSAIYLNPNVLNSGKVLIRNLKFSITSDSTDIIVNPYTNPNCNKTYGKGAVRPGFVQSIYRLCNNSDLYDLKLEEVETTYSFLSSYSLYKYPSFSLVGNQPTGKVIPIKVRVETDEGMIFNFSTSYTVGNHRIVY